ncbi:MAG: LEA type 2 family protein [bacterium]
MKKLYILTCLAVLSGCASTAGVDVYLTSITPLPSTLFEQRVRLDLRVKNLQETPIQASGIDVSLRLNGKRLARGVDGQAISVPRLGETTASVVVSSSIFDTVKQLLSMRERDVFTYGLSGKLITPGIDKRFNRSGEISRADLQPLVQAAD